MSFPTVSQRAARVAFLFLPIVLFAPGMANADPRSDATVPWIQTYLDEFSIVLDTHPDRGREFIATQLTAPKRDEALVLVYERTRYLDSEVDTADSRQRIHYTFELSDLNPETMHVQSWTGSLSDTSYYMVLVNVTESKGFLDYSNIVEKRLPDGSVDVTSSRGKARTLALGYFTSEENARTLADAAKRLLESARAETGSVDHSG